MPNINVLVTTPSISIENNVSGIANMTRLWVENNSVVNYSLFEAGKKDKTDYGILWLFYQPLVLLKFIIRILMSKIDVVHINMPLEKFAIFREYIFILCALIFKKPLILHLRGGFYSLNLNVPPLINYFITFSIKKATKIIVLGHIESQFLIDNYSVDISKIIVLPNCVKVPERIVDNKSINKDKLELLFIGRLDKNKGLNEIIESLELLVNEINFVFRIAGDGPDKDWFLHQCDLKIPNNYDYQGVVSGKQKSELFQNSDLFLLPSYFEGLPNALLEAMSYGIVPIVTPVGAISSVVAHNKNGLLVPVKSVNDIISAILSISNDITVYNKLSKEAYLTIFENFSINNYLISINKLYSDILNE